MYMYVLVHMHVYVCVVWQNFPGEMQHTCLLTTDRELLTVQSTNTTKVQLAEPMSSIGVTAHPSMDDNSQSWEPGEHHKVEFNRLESDLPKWLWPNLSQAAGLVSDLAAQSHCLLWQGGAYWLCSVSGTSWSYFKLFTFLPRELPAG